MKNKLRNILGGVGLMACFAVPFALTGRASADDNGCPRCDAKFDVCMQGIQAAEAACLERTDIPDQDCIDQYFSELNQCVGEAFRCYQGACHGD